MEAFTCSICFNQFNKDNFVPKALDCGHTFCSMCLKKLLMSPILPCPTCKRKGTTRSLSDYPTIYALIISPEDIAEDSPLTNKLKSFKKRLNEKRDALINGIDLLENDIKAKIKILQCVNNGICRLEEIETITIKDMNYEEIRKSINEIEKESELTSANPQDPMKKKLTVLFDLKYYLKKIVPLVFVILFLPLLQPSSTVTESCTAPAVNIEGHCLLFVMVTYTNWNTARSNCQKKGGDLLDFNTPIFKALINVPVFKEESFWIGLKREAFTDTFYSLNGEKVSSENPFWGPSQPNELYIKHACAVVYYRALSDFFIWDYPCADSYYNVYSICDLH